MKITIDVNKLLWSVVLVVVVCSVSMLVVIFLHYIEKFSFYPLVLFGSLAFFLSLFVYCNYQYLLDGEK